VFQKKHVTTSSAITWTRIVCLQQFLAHLLLRVCDIDRCFYFPIAPISCTYFTLGNCRDLNIRKKIKQKSWKFHRKMRFWFKISICVEAVWCTKDAKSIFQQRAESWNFEASTLCKTDTIVRLPGSGRQRIRRVLSQEDKPKRHRAAREISHETAILRSSVHRIIHRDLQLNCFIRRHAQLLSEANRITHLIRW